MRLYQKIGWLCVAVVVLAMGVRGQGRQIGTGVGGGQADGGRRMALVLGNGAYEHIRKLRNPTNDATDMAASLRELGFEVVVATDANQRTMKRLIQEFGGFVLNLGMIIN